MMFKFYIYTYMYIYIYIWSLYPRRLNSDRCYFIQCKPFLFFLPLYVEYTIASVLIHSKLTLFVLKNLVFKRFYLNKQMFGCRNH